MGYLYTVFIVSIILVICDELHVEHKRCLRGYQPREPALFVCLVGRDHDLCPLSDTQLVIVIVVVVVAVAWWWAVVVGAGRGGTVAMAQWW